MSRGIKKQYKKARIAFKQELKELYRKDKNLENFVIEIYCCEHNKSCLKDLYDWLSANCPSQYDAFFNKNPEWFALGNELGIWRAFKGAYPEIIDKYMDKIPASKAFGDALAVLINNDRQEDKNV